MREARALLEAASASLWERKDVGEAARFYAPYCVVHDCGGVRYGPDEAAAALLSRFVAFPDARLFLRDLVGNDEHVFARWVWTGRNDGHSSFGPPTGREITVGMFATYQLRDGQIVEQWILEDELSLATQLGIDPVAAASRVSAIAAGTSGEAAGLAVDAGTGDGLLRRAIEDVWNRRLLGRVDELYHRDFHWQDAAERAHHSRDELRAEVIARLAAFPDARVLVDEDFGDASAMAARLTLTGTHLGAGPYGAPTGRRVRLNGMTQLRVEGDRIVAAWELWDELRLLAQIVSGATASEVEGAKLDRGPAAVDGEDVPSDHLGPV